MTADGGSWVDLAAGLLDSLGIGGDSAVPWWAWPALVVMLLLGFVPSGADDRSPEQPGPR